MLSRIPLFRYLMFIILLLFIFIWYTETRETNMITICPVTGKACPYDQKLNSGVCPKEHECDIIRAEYSHMLKKPPSPRKYIFISLAVVLALATLFGNHRFSPCRTEIRIHYSGSPGRWKFFHSRSGRCPPPESLPGQPQGQSAHWFFPGALPAADTPGKRQAAVERRSQRLRSGLPGGV